MEFMSEEHLDFNSEVFTVPDPDASWFPEINEFALTWNAYDRIGELSKVSRIAKKVDQAIDEGQLAKVRVDDLRTTLFFYQRRTHHHDTEPPKRRVRAVLTELIAKTGGTVPGPADALP
jgi:hypothetical protein